MSTEKNEQLDGDEISNFKKRIEVLEEVNHQLQIAIVERDKEILNLQKQLVYVKNELLRSVGMLVTRERTYSANQSYVCFFSLSLFLSFYSLSLFSSFFLSLLFFCSPLFIVCLHLLFLSQKRRGLLWWWEGRKRRTKSGRQ